MDISAVEKHQLFQQLRLLPQALGCARSDGGRDHLNSRLGAGLDLKPRPGHSGARGVTGRTPPVLDRYRADVLGIRCAFWPGKRKIIILII